MLGNEKLTFKVIEQGIIAVLKISQLQSKDPGLSDNLNKPALIFCIVKTLFQILYLETKYI